MTAETEFWQRPETVARFRDKDPDLHLLEILDAVADPSALPTLDLGCAGGRNAAALASRAVPVVALDSSLAMCAATRDRIGRRAVEGRMDDLPFPDRAFALVVALGVYHQGASGTEVRRAVTETARVLRPGGRALVSVFASAMLGPDATPVPGEPLLHDTPDRGRVVRFTPDRLETTFRDAGFSVDRPIEERRGRMANGERVSLLAIFMRR